MVAFVWSFEPLGVLITAFIRAGGGKCCSETQFFFVCLFFAVTLREKPLIQSHDSTQCILFFKVILNKSTEQFYNVRIQSVA